MLNKANILLDEINQMKNKLRIKERELNQITREYDLTILENEVVENKLDWCVNFDIDAHGYFLYDDDEFMHNLKQGMMAFNETQKQELQPILNNMEKMKCIEDDEERQNHELYNSTLTMLSAFQQKHELYYGGEKLLGFDVIEDERGNIEIIFDVDWEDEGEDGFEHYYVSICKGNVYVCDRSIEIIEER